MMKFWILMSDHLATAGLIYYVKHGLFACLFEFDGITTFIG